MKNIHSIKKLTATPLYARLNQPFTIATGAHTALENVLAEIELADGTKGYGEATPAAHITGETQKDTLANINALTPELRGRSVCDYLEISRLLAGELAHNRCAATAVEAAMFDALGKQLNIPMWKFFGSACTKLYSDMTVVLGGLIQTEKDNSDNKVPLLGDIPFLGKALFAGTYRNKSKSELVIFLTPHIVNGNEHSVAGPDVGFEIPTNSVTGSLSRH